MKFLLLTIFFYLQKMVTSNQKFNKIKYSKNNNIFITNSKILPINSKNASLKKFHGNDERYTGKETVEIDNIYSYMKSKHKLDILQDNSINMYDKLELLRDNTIKPINLQAGGLMSHYYFDLDA